MVGFSVSSTSDRVTSWLAGATGVRYVHDLSDYTQLGETFLVQRSESTIIVLYSKTYMTSLAQFNGGLGESERRDVETSPPNFSFIS